MWRFIFKLGGFCSQTPYSGREASRSFQNLGAPWPIPLSRRAQGKPQRFVFDRLSFLYPDHSKTFVGRVTRWSLSAPPQHGQVIERRGSRSVLGKTTLKPQVISIRE